MGCCGSTNIQDDLIESIDIHLETLSITPNEKDKIKDEICQKVLLALKNDENKISNFNTEERRIYIDDKKNQIKLEVDSYISIYDKLLERKTIIVLNERERSILIELESKVKNSMSKYRLPDLKKELIVNTWKKCWSEIIHKEVEVINKMSIEKREKYISMEWYNSQKYLDTLYSVISSKNNI